MSKTIIQSLFHSIALTYITISRNIDLIKSHVKSMSGAMYSFVPNSGKRLGSSFKKSRGIGTRAPLVDFKSFIASKGSLSSTPVVF